MDIWSINTFLTLAEVKRLNECAQLLCVTKSAVSSRIKQLESHLDQTLFSRSNQGMLLTPAGHKFYQHAQVLQRRWEQAKLEIKLDDLQGGGILRIATHTTLAHDLLLMWGSELKARKPELTLHMSADYSVEIVKQVATGKVDIGLVFAADTSTGLIVEQICIDELIMVSSQACCVSDVKPSEYLYLDWGWGWGYSTAHNERLPHLEHCLQSSGLGGIGLSWLLSNGGCAYLPRRSVARHLENARLFEVTDAPNFNRPIFATYPRESQNSESLDFSLKALASFINDSHFKT